MLYDFAHRFPVFVAGFLERSRSLKRRFREESVTDMMMASLIPLQGKGIIVEFPNEPRTGADMEWNFVREDRSGFSGFYRVYVQAKRLYGDGELWRRHSYRQLLHQTGNPKQLQAVVLAETARKFGRSCYPLYAFYNPQKSCDLAAKDVEQIAGVNLADGFEVEAIAKAAKSTRDVSLGAIHQHLFRLSDVFCPGASTPPDPQTVCDRMAAQRKRIHERLTSDQAEVSQEKNTLPPVPNIAQEVPKDVLDLIQCYRGRAVIQKVPRLEVPGLDRWRITFISKPDSDLQEQD